MDDHVETQVSETLEKSLGIFVRSVPDAHTCRSVEVLVVYYDAFAHLLKIHVILICRHLVPGGLDWLLRGIFLLIE